MTRPRVHSSTPVYEGAIIRVRVDEIELADGARAKREVVEHPGAVAIVALDGAQRVVLVRQYRHPTGRSLLELPAGTLEAGEDPQDTAVRELEEEVGLRADDWQKLGSFFSSPGFVREEIHAFLARGLTQVPANPDEDEDIEVVWMPLDDILDRPEDLADAKTLASLLLAVRSDIGTGKGMGGPKT